MASSDGRALLSGSATDEWLDLRARQRAADAFVTALVALHSVDPEVIGLGDLGRAEGYVARQLSTWYQSWTTATNRACYDDDRAHTLHATLSERIPDSSPARLVHGDYGPHNTLFVSSGEISAVLDWEIATLGDPLVDLAYAVNGWVGPGDEKADLADPPTRRPGFPDRQVIIDRYAEKAGADLSNFTFYRVFNYWRRACILQGVYGRYRAGQRQGSDGDANAVRRRIPILLKAAVDLGAKFDGRSW
jgi:aminoglycoside phosphotransferase (APT) family kinase protein